MKRKTVFLRTHWEITKVCFSWISIYCKEGVGDEIKESVTARTDQKNPCQTCPRFWSLHARRWGAMKRLSVGNDTVRIFRTIPVAGVRRKNERWVSIGGRETCYETVTVTSVGDEDGWQSGSGDGEQEACGRIQTGRFTKTREGEEREESKDYQDFGLVSGS